MASPIFARPGVGRAPTLTERHRSSLAAQVARLEALVQQRFEGWRNLGPRLLSRMGGGGRQVAESRLKEARALLQTVQGKVAEPEVARQVLHAVSEGYWNGTRRHDAFIDDATEYGVSNLIGLASTAYMERKYAAMEREGKTRWDTQGTWNGVLRALPYHALPYYLGLAVARGRNFWGIARAELEATVIMVVGSHLAIVALEQCAHLSPPAAALLGAAITGFGAGAWCYWRADPATVNTSLLKAGLRAAFNVAIRMGLGRVLFRRSPPVMA